MSKLPKMEKPIGMYVIIVLITLVALYIIKVLDISYPINVRSSQVSSELAVVGEGKVDVIPNSATVSVGVSVVNAATVQAAQQQINETNNKIVQALAGLNIPKNQIKTSGYNINPSYQYDGGPERISGYSGSVTIDITVKKIDQLPQVIQAATNAGANQVFSTQMMVDDPAVYRAQARQKAIDNARTQAKALADELGIKLGKVVNIVESSDQNAQPIYYDKANMGGGANPALDLQPGTQTIYSTVTLYFDKK
jgi:uncharacterized protein YggE